MGPNKDVRGVVFEGKDEIQPSTKDANIRLVNRANPKNNFIFRNQNYSSGK